jgi:hypothetical protein
MEREQLADIIYFISSLDSNSDKGSFYFMIGPGRVEGRQPGWFTESLQKISQ